MPYQLLLCDVDNTLLDFTRSEKLALIQTLESFGMAPTDANIAAYVRINHSLWEALERGETTQNNLRVNRFTLLLKHLGLNPIQGDDMARYFAGALGQQAHLMPGALDFVKAVSKRMPIYLVTNGITAIQKSRLGLSGLRPYISHTLISEEAGAAKPDPLMTLMALEHGGMIPKSQAVMLGDSLTSDIAAAINAGIDSIYLSWDHPAAACPATYQAATLAAAQAIILGAI